MVESKTFTHLETHLPLFIIYLFKRNNANILKFLVYTQNVNVPELAKNLIFTLPNFVFLPLFCILGRPGVLQTVPVPVGRHLIQTEEHHSPEHHSAPVLRPVLLCYCVRYLLLRPWLQDSWLIVCMLAYVVIMCLSPVKFTGTVWRH